MRGTRPTTAIWPPSASTPLPITSAMIKAAVAGHSWTFASTTPASLLSLGATRTDDTPERSFTYSLRSGKDCRGRNAGYEDKDSRKPLPAGAEWRGNPSGSIARARCGTWQSFAICEKLAVDFYDGRWTRFPGWIRFFLVLMLAWCLLTTGCNPQRCIDNQTCRQ